MEILLNLIKWKCLKDNIYARGSVPPFYGIFMERRDPVILTDGLNLIDPECERGKLIL